MFVVVLLTTVLKQNAQGGWEVASVTTTIIPGFKTGQLASVAANALGNADQVGIQRHAFVFQQE